MSKSMKVLVLAGVLSIAVASAVQAGGKVVGSEFHASAAPACDTEKCPVLATDGPGSPGDNNGRAELVIGIHSMMAGGKPTGMDFHANAAQAGDTGKNVASTTARSGQIPRLWHPVLADNGSAGGMNDDNGGSTEGGRGGISGDV
jgi:hypothetical protein